MGSFILRLFLLECYLNKKVPNQNQEIMFQKIISYLLFFVFLGGIFCIMFFKLTPLSPKPVKIENSKSYFDIYDKPIIYKLSIAGEISYSQWINPWKRDDFEDSLKVFSKLSILEFICSSALLTFRGALVFFSNAT